MKISGVVYDSTGSNKLTDAIVIAVRIKDSLLLGYTRTNEQGKFDLKNIPIDTFNLIVSHFRFDDKSYFIFGSTENNEIEIPTIRLQSKAKEIQEVVIYANKNPIYFRGDTLVYVADSFKVGQNAVVEDLLKKLPGITVEKNGSIKVQGKEISKVFVDGDEFFGTDPTIATKNLSADGIKTVEVYETKNENAAEGESETIQVMDLKLKEAAKKGYFGRISGASDLNNFYEGELLFNNFNKSQKLSVFLLGSNTPRSNFNWQDINQFGLDNEGGYSQNEDGDWYSTGNNNDGNGIPQTLRSGIYFSDKVGKNKKSKVNFNYTYNNYQLKSTSQSYSQYFLSDTTYYSSDSTKTKSKNDSHSINFTFFSQLDSLTTLEIKPSVKFSNGSTETADYSHFITSEQLTSRSNIVNKGNDSKGMNVTSDIKLVHDFKKPRRQIKLQHKMNYDLNNSEGNLNYQNLYYLGTSINDTINQLKINDNSNHLESGKLTYTEPLSKKWKFETEYLFEYTTGKQEKETRNILANTATEIDSNFSNNFENFRRQNRLSFSLIYESKKQTLSFGVRLRNISLDNINRITAVSINQSINNILPKLSYTFVPSQTKRLSVRYSTNSNLPSINALQPVNDNSNPNHIQIGNPSLKPTFVHNGDLNFNAWNGLSNRYMWSGLNFSYTNNGFVDSTVFDDNGRQYSKFINANGNMWASAYFGGGISLYKKIIEASPRISGSYSRNLSYINGVENIKTSTNLSGFLSLNFNFDSLSISIHSELSYMSPSSTISALTNQPYTNQLHSAEFSWILPFWHITLKTDLNYTINGQRANGYNLNYLIWNASISKSLFKAENLIISIEGNDMLNQNINADRLIDSNVITDNKTKIISRYYLLRLTYKFNNKKSKEEEDEWN